MKSSGIICHYTLLQNVNLENWWMLENLRMDSAEDMRGLASCPPPGGVSSPPRRRVMWRG